MRQIRNVRNGMNKRRWRNQLRPQVLARDGYNCRLGLPGCSLVATTVHLDPALQGNHDIATIDDCVSACRSCHGKVDAARSHENR